jgi:ABC-type Fe3+-hydroxamate transport system substrate-binding protein
VSTIDRRAFVTSAIAAALSACGRTERDPGSRSTARRIVSQTISSDEILWALGEPVRARVVAVSSLVDDARYSTIPGTWPQAVPRTPTTSEALLALAPDLAIVADFTAAETIALLENARVPLLRLSGFDGFADHRRHVAEIAEAVFAPDEGTSLVRAFDDRLAAVRAPVGGTRPSIVSFTEGNVAGAGTTFQDIAEAAGYDNLPARDGMAGHRRIALDRIVAWDPEALVVPCGEDDAEAVTADIAARPGLKATRAVRDGRVIAIPSALLYSSGAAMLDVVERLRARHPEVG